MASGTINFNDEIYVPTLNSNDDLNDLIPSGRRWFIIGRTEYNNPPANVPNTGIPSYNLYVIRCGYGYVQFAFNYNYVGTLYARVLFGSTWSSWTSTLFQ